VIVREELIVVVGAAALLAPVEVVLNFEDDDLVDADAVVAVAIGIGIEFVLFKENGGEAGLVFAIAGARLAVVRGIRGLAVLEVPFVDLVEVVLLNGIV
jgi:hypothetical protein